MKELRATVLVGLLAMVSVALVIFGVLNTKRGIGDDEQTWMVEAIFNDVTGIASGTKVTIAGFPVGEVKRVTLVGTEVQVMVRLRNDVVLYGGVEREGSLVNAAMLTRVQASLLGDYYLELKPGAAGKRLVAGDRIPIVITATAIEATMKRLETAAEVIPNVNRIASDVAAITGNARKVFGSEDGAARFDEIADNMVISSRNLVETTDLVRKRFEVGTFATGGELDKSVASISALARQASHIAQSLQTTVDKGGPSALRSLANVEDVTQNVRTLLGRNEKGVENAMGTLTSALKKIEDTLARLDGVVANLEAVTAKARNGEGAIGRLLTNDTLVREAEGVVKDTRSLVNRFSNLQTGIDYQTNYYATAPPSDAERWRSQVTLRFQPSGEKYYLATISSDIYPVTRTLVRSTGTTGTGGDTLKTDSIREVGDTVKLGLQYVRRFGPVTLRGGLIESRAGFGMDAFAWQDRLQAFAEVFQLTDPQPRLRAGLIVRLLPWAYLQAGGDSLMSSERAFFIGAGLFFRDDDLLLLFASAPSVQL